MPKRSDAGEHAHLRKWRGHYLVSGSAIERMRARMGHPSRAGVRSRGLDPARWTDDPAGLAVRSLAEHHPEGWVVGLAELADELKIDVEGLLTFAVVTELRSRAGVRGELDLRGKRPGFAPDEANRHLAFLDAVKDAALAAATARDQRSAIQNALREHDTLEVRSRQDPLEIDDGLVAGILSRLGRYRGRPAELAMELLREREPRLQNNVANPADFRRNLRRAALRRPAHEGTRYRQCRQSTEAALRELASQRLKPPPK